MASLDPSRVGPSARQGHAAPPASGANRRRAPRLLEPSGILCDKGAIGDLSLSGVRVLTRCRWPEGHHDLVTLSDATRRVRIEVMCMWCREAEDGGHAVGLCFSGLSEGEARQLEAMLSDADSRRRAAAA